MEKYTDYIIDTAKKLLAIPSPTRLYTYGGEFCEERAGRYGI